MQEEAEANKVEDEKKKELVGARNAADALVITAEKALKDAGDKVDAEIKTQVEEKVKAVKDVMNSENKEEIEKMTGELSETLQKVGEKLYAAAQPQGDAKPEESTPTEEKKNDKKDGDVEEGEVIS
jgi:molecular chaperone DnaK